MNLVLLETKVYQKKNTGTCIFLSIPEKDPRSDRKQDVFTEAY